MNLCGVYNFIINFFVFFYMNQLKKIRQGRSLKFTVLLGGAAFAVLVGGIFLNSAKVKAQTSLPTAGMVGYWNFDEGTGTSAADSSGLGNSGTFAGGATWTTGKTGSALSLDGQTGYVNMGNAQNLQIANGTLSAWIKTSDAGANDRTIIGKRDAYNLSLNNNMLMVYDWSNFTEHTSTVNLADNTWHHVAVTFVSGVANGTVLYVDGVQKLVTTITIPNQVSYLSIGNQYATIQNFKGSIDEARVYNRVLSLAEIQALANTLPPVTTGPTITPPQVTCSASPSSPNVGDQVTWSSQVSNASGAVAYSWTGTDGISGSSATLQNTYATAGTKTATITVTSGGLTATNNCSLNVSAPVVTNPTSPVTNTSGLVGYWDFDSRSGNSLADSSGNGNAATLIGTGALVTGVSGSAVSLDGQTGYVDAGNPASLQLTKGTVGAWIKTSDAGSGYRSIIGKRDAYDLILNNNFVGTYDWGSFTDNFTNVNLADNTWHYVAMSFQSGVPNGTIVYVDGVQKLVTTVVTPNQVSGLDIGNESATIQNFKGSIDEVRIYNRVLSPAEISALSSGAPTTSSGNNALPLQISCSANPSTLSVGSPVAWTAQVSNATTAVAYSWNGTDSLTGATAVVQKTYTLAGTKSATVTASSGGQTVSASCSATVNAVVVVPPPVTVVPPPANPGTNLSTCGFGTNFYASPTGLSSGAGTIASPWDLGSALSKSSSVVHPGDTIWLLAGTYHENNAPTKYIATLSGASGSPISVCAYPGARATIDGNLYQIVGGWVNYQGIEVENLQDFTSADPSFPAPFRTTTANGPFPMINNIGPWWAKYNGKYSDFNVSGLDIHASNIKLINMIVHDNIGGGIGLDKTAEDSDVYGSLSYYNGWQGGDRGHGHGIYGQNSDPYHKTMIDSLFFKNFGLGMQLYGDSATADNLTVDGNASFENGILARDHQANILIGTVEGAQSKNLVFTNNYVYDTMGSGSDTNFGYYTGLTNWLVKNNYFGTSVYFASTNSVSTMTLSGNTFGLGTQYLCTIYPADCQRAYPTNIFLSSHPTTNFISVRPNQYEIGRANIIAYNWQNLPSITVDISTIGLKVGDQYEVHNVEDYYNDITTGTYTGAPITISMLATDHSVAKPIGNEIAKPISTLPQFGTFVIVKKVGAATPVVTPVIPPVVSPVIPPVTPPVVPPVVTPGTNNVGNPAGSGGGGTSPTTSTPSPATNSTTVATTNTHSGGGAGNGTIIATSATTPTTIKLVPIATTTATKATTTLKFTFTRYLGVGSTLTDVTRLQQILKQLGYFKAGVTGYFGSITKAAVQAFQAKHSFEQTGGVGPLTRAELNKLL